MSFTNMEHRSNGVHKAFDESENIEKRRHSGILERIQINEWSFSLLLFCFSLSIVLGKLILNYGDVLCWLLDGHYKLPSLPALPSMSNFSSLSNLKPSAQFLSEQLKAASKETFRINLKYEEAVLYAATEFSKKYWAWMRPAISGLAMMGFTWYIIYKDSSVPGVNPQSPLRLLKKRGSSRSSLQINYLVGVLNGILIFIYLSL